MNALESRVGGEQCRDWAKVREVYVSESTWGSMDCSCEWTQ